MNQLAKVIITGKIHDGKVQNREKRKKVVVYTACAAITDATM